MKKYLVVLLVAGVLCGCAAEPTFETVDDTQIVSAVAPVRTVQMDFPPEAATPVMESAEGGALYQCDGYVLTVQTLSGGDLDRTLRQLDTGRSTYVLSKQSSPTGCAMICPGCPQGRAGRKSADVFCWTMDKIITLYL